MPTPPPDAAMTPAPAAVSVVFNVQPLVGDKPPVLTVTVRNPTSQAIPLTRFSDPRCFAHFTLELQLTRPDGRPVTLAPCAVKDWPGTDGTLAAHAEERVVVPLAAVSSAWPLGTYAIDVRWDPKALVAARGGGAAHASDWSLNESAFTIAKALATVKVEPGKPVLLPDGLQLTFMAHGHKRVLEGGPPSPLIIRGSTKGPGARDATEFEVSVFADESRIFRIDRSLVFELGAYQYDRFMELRYFGRIP